MTYVGEVRSLWLVTADQPTGDFAASHVIGYASLTGRLVKYSVQVVPAVAHVPLYTASVGTLEIRAKQRPSSFTLAECFVIDRLSTHPRCSNRGRKGHCWLCGGSTGMPHIGKAGMQ
jgi:hypothetical protein